MDNPINYWYQKYLALKAKMGKMMDGAVEGTVDFEYFGYKVIRPDLKQLDTLLESMNHGDKVRLIVLPKED